VNQFEWVVGAFERLFPGGEKRYQAGASRHARSTASSSIGLPLWASQEELGVTVVRDAAARPLGQRLTAGQKRHSIHWSSSFVGASESARDHPRRSVTLVG